VLTQGAPEVTAVERRGRDLLESGPEYFGDPPGGWSYRRVGSLRIPPEEQIPPGCERIDRSAVEARFPGEVDGGCRARFCPADGAIDPLALGAALHGRVRAQGGRVILDAELLELREEEDGVSFTSAARSGRAARVSLTAGVGILRFLPALGVRHRWVTEVVHRFRLSSGQEEGALLWFPERGTVLTPLGRGEWELEVAVPSDGSPEEDPTVDWTRLERSREELVEVVPWLSSIEVRRGRAVRRLAFDPEVPLLDSRQGRISAGGAFGPHGIGLFPAVGEQLAERALAPLGEAGGILEEA